MLFATFDTVAQSVDVDDVFDVAAAAHLPAFVVFPEIRDERQLLDQLASLAQGERWKITREKVKGLTTDDLLLGIQWTTGNAGVVSMPMGFAPLPTMPVTRRAPYVCLATWPGGHENPSWTKHKPSVVDFLDARMPDEPFVGAKYKLAWKASVDRTKELLSQPADDANFYRKVAFRLSASASRHRVGR